MKNKQLQRHNKLNNQTNIATYLISLINMVSSVGAYTINAISHLGAIFMLLCQIIINFLYPIKKFHLIMKEIFFSGVLSIIIISISGLFVGMVLGLQAYNTLAKFGSISMLGSMVALSLLRELGPVLTAILFASRAGSGITAEIGLMKATDQLNAMEIMAVSPIKRILAPKFLGAIISLPLLSALFNMMGIIGAYMIGVLLLHLDSGIFFSQMQDSVSLSNDIINGIIKSIIFAIAVSLIAVYQGYIAKPTPEGVSIATTRTVVVSALTVLFLDFILTVLMFS